MTLQTKKEKEKSAQKVCPSIGKMGADAVFRRRDSDIALNQWAFCRELRKPWKTRKSDIIDSTVMT